MSRPRITACICTYNRYDVLPKAIESLLAQTLPRDQYRIIVVDNSPNQEDAEAFGEQYRQFPPLEYVVEKIPGLSNARNVAARMCGTAYIAFMDDDAVAAQDWLERILEAFEVFGDEAAIVGGRVDPMWEIPRPKWLHDSIMGFVSVVNWGGGMRVADDKEWFAGTNIAFKTAGVLSYGGFDVKLGRTGGGTSLLSNEEVELVKRMKADGGVAVYQPEAVVQHLVERKRLKQGWFRKRMAWQAASDFIMNPEETAKSAKKNWDYLLDYFFGLPPKERNIRGLYYPCDDPELFKKQLGCIYIAEAGILAGFEGLDAVGL